MTWLVGALAVLVVSLNVHRQTAAASGEETARGEPGVRRKEVGWKDLPEWNGKRMMLDQWKRLSKEESCDIDGVCEYTASGVNNIKL